MSSGIIYTGGHGLKIENCTISNESEDYERGRAAGRAEERAEIVAMLEASIEQAKRWGSYSDRAAFKASVLSSVKDIVAARALAPAEEERP